MPLIDTTDGKAFSSSLMVCAVRDSCKYLRIRFCLASGGSDFGACGLGEKALEGVCNTDHCDLMMTVLGNIDHTRHRAFILMLI